MRQLATRIQIQAKIRAPFPPILKCDVDTALANLRLAASIVSKTREDAKTSLDDVGGMEREKRKLTEVLIWPSKYSEVFRSYGVRNGKGVLLHGPSGCGKTLLARAIAAESKFECIFIKGPELLSKYIGSSEENVRNVFERARASSPCIIIFDELDSLAPQRGSDNTGVTDRVVNQLLTEMDGAEGLQGVFVIGCTSRMDLIDPALLRPGRFDHLLECGIPSKEDRADILRIILRSVNFDPELSIPKWVARTDGWTGADLKALITNAQFDALRKTSNDSLKAVVTDSNIGAVFQDSLPRQSGGIKKQLKELRRSIARENKQQNSSNTPDWSAVEPTAPRAPTPAQSQLRHTRSGNESATHVMTWTPAPATLKGLKASDSVLRVRDAPRMTPIST
ncbi:hypothetical protein Y032_0437g1452 [Ancylostoma ceylanicum]|nr:hypothetical protein Y032_0437g1452 [Ancylostoma ceylanicum]